MLQAKTLSNGLKFSLSQVKSPVMHISLMMHCGTRFEEQGEHGLAHFLEHMLFKGTSKRKAYHILSRLDDVGGDLNAYTTKEELCIHATFLKPYFSRAVELLADIVQNSSFPDKEINKEKEVVIDEIDSYDDAPSDLIFEDFEELLFQEHALAKSILGTKESVRSFKGSQLKSFTKTHFIAQKMSLAVVGDISPERLRKGLEKHFAAIPSQATKDLNLGFKGYEAKDQNQFKDTSQSHCVIGSPAYPSKHENFIGFSLLNNLLGGTGMNNRLNLNIREKYGFTYHLESYYQPYLDTGVFGIYLGTDKNNLKKSKSLVYKELKKLRETKLGILQLHKAKSQLIGQLALNRENNLARSQSAAKSMLLQEPFQSFDTMAAKIEAITAENLMDYANEIFPENRLSSLTYQAK